MYCSTPGYKTLYWPSVPFRDQTIECKSLSVCLGIAIDEGFSWANHVKSVSSSYSFKVKMLRRTSFLPKATQETIYYKTVIPSTL